MRYLASLLIVAVVAGLGFVGLSHYVNTAYGQSSNLVKVETTPGANSVNGAFVLSLLNKISSIALDGKFLSAPAFQSLQDFSISIAPQPSGRSNPYLPVNGVTKVVPVAKTTTSTKSSTKKTTTAPSTPLFFLGN